MNLFDPDRPQRAGLSYLLTGSIVPTLHIKPLEGDMVQVMVFLKVHGYKDFTTKMTLWRLTQWLEEWIDNPEFICERDFKYTGPQETDTLPGDSKKVTLEQLGLMMAEDGY